MLKKLFVEHPQSVGESYLEHMAVAFGFGFSMLGAALACIIHGLVPAMFKGTGSKAILCLHDRLIAKRSDTVKAHHRAPRAPAIALTSQPTLDFSI